MQFADNQVEHFAADRGHARRGNLGAHFARGAHRAQDGPAGQSQSRPPQLEPAHARPPPAPTVLRCVITSMAFRSSAGVVNPRLMPVVMMPVPIGLVRTSKSPGARVGVGHHAARRNHPCDSEPINRLWILDRVAAEQDAFRFLDLFRAATQDLVHRLERHNIGRHAHDVQRCKRSPAHGINVGQRVGRGDLAVPMRIVDDRREEIRGLHERAIAVNAIHPGVVPGGRADQEISILQQ